MHRLTREQRIRQYEGYAEATLVLDPSDHAGAQRYLDLAAFERQEIRREQEAAERRSQAPA